MKALKAHAGLLTVLAIAITLRVMSYTAIVDGPLPYYHRWTETDMHFFNSWAQQIAAGDWLTEQSARPSHSWHDHIAREIHETASPGEPYGEHIRRGYWDGWLGEKTFYQDPLYPYMLALVYASAGESLQVVFWIQMILGVASVALVYALARLLFTPGVALVAGVMAALFGPPLLYEVVLLRTTLITFTGLASLTLAAVALRHPEKKLWYLATGFVCGVSLLVKSSGLLFFVAVIGLMLHKFRNDWRLAANRSVLAAVGLLLAMSPVVARNMALGVSPLSLASSGAITFINHNGVDYAPDGGDTLSEHAAEILQRSNGKLLPAMAETIRTHPAFTSWIGLLAGKFWAFWHWYEVPNNSSYDYYRLEVGAISMVMVNFSLIGALAPVGMVLALRRSYSYALTLVYILCGLSTVVIFYHLSRFRIPIAMAMIPFAAYTPVALFQFFKARQNLKTILTVATVLVSAAVVLRPLPKGHFVLRVADMGVPNEITLNLARLSAEQGDLGGAIARLDCQLALEPSELQDLEPGPRPSSLSSQAAALAGLFLPLHELNAELNARLGQMEQAKYHLRRAQVLRVLDRQFKQVQ